MPKSVSSYYDDAVHSDEEGAEHQTLLDNSGYLDGSDRPTAPPSPIASRSKLRATRFSEVDLHNRLHPHRAVDENSSLLGNRDHLRAYATSPATPRPRHNRHNSGSVRRPRHHSRRPSFSNRLVAALGQEQRQALRKSAMSLLLPCGADSS